MAIITFMSNERKETGQTLSLAAVATQMAIEHNYKTLIVSTSFEDKILESCFWDLDKIHNVKLLGEQEKVGVESGIEGLIKVLASNRTSPEIVRNYSKIVLRDRLDVLMAPATSEYKEYAEITPLYADIIQIASRYYDMILVDLSNRMPEQDYQNIVQMSDVVVVNLTQRLSSMDHFVKLREENEFYKKKNVMLLIGRYDSFSKYNIKNVTRYLKERKSVNAIPYNTLFFEACAEGKIIDFFLKIKIITDETDRNHVFYRGVADMGEAIIYKLEELKMKL